MSTPRTEAIAFRLWAYASPRGWDCTAAEAADALDVSTRVIGAVSRRKGWTERFRVTHADPLSLTAQSGMVGDFDAVMQ